MMDLNNIFEKIKNAKVEICKNDINLPTGDKVSVTGFGVCENNDYSENSYRYYLEFNIDKPLSKKGTLFSILMNPSNKTNPNKNIDWTIQNVIKMAYIVGYSKVVILNSFALIQSNGNLAEKNFEDNNFEKLNKKFIKEFINKNSDKDILCAWGTKSKIADLEFVNKSLKNKFVYSITKKDFPRHSSPYNSKKVNEFILEQNKQDIKARTFTKISGIKPNGKVEKQWRKFNEV